MSSRYVTVTEAEIAELFQKKCWTRGTTGKEVVYDYVMQCGVTLRVLTSLKDGRNTARGKGQDAIRICAFNAKTNRGVRKSVRVYRVPGWQDRVKAKVEAMVADIKAN